MEPSCYCDVIIIVIHSCVCVCVDDTPTEAPESAAAETPVAVPDYNVQDRVNICVKNNWLNGVVRKVNADSDKMQVYILPQKDQVPGLGVEVFSDKVVTVHNRFDEAQVSRRTGEGERFALANKDSYRLIIGRCSYLLITPLRRSARRKRPPNYAKMVKL